MRDFKFFEKGTLDMMDGETYATASFHMQTPEGVMGRRRLYHTNLPEYQRLREEDEVMTQQQYNLNRDMLSEQERVRRLEMLNHIRVSENQIRLFQATTGTTVNPKWWMKVKMFFQNLLLYSDQVAGIAVIATIITFIVILVISKILSVW